MESKNYLIHSNISWKLLKDAVVAVNTDNGSYYTFNPTASAVWQLIDEGNTATEIVNLFKEQFPEQLEETIEKDVEEIIVYWESEKLIHNK
jgi:hypothetical protein